MLPGLNTDVRHEGSGYHVQTEDLGEKHPIILTLVYRCGAVVLREQFEYGDLFGGRLSAAQIRTLMEAQHRRIMRLVAAGDIASGAPAGTKPASSPWLGLPEPPPALASKAVDDLIEEYLHTRRRTKICGAPDGEGHVGPSPPQVPGRAGSDSGP